MKTHTLIFLGVGAAALGVVLSLSDLEATWRHVWQVGWGFFIILALYMGEFLAATRGWQHTFSPLAGARLTTYRLWHIMMVGEALNLVSAHLGGEGAKVLLLKRLDGVPYSESIAAIFLFRTMVVLTLVVFSLAGFLLAAVSERMPESTQSFAIGGFIFYCIAVAIMLLAPKLRIASRAGRLILRGRARAFLDHITALEEKLAGFYHTRRRALALSALFSLANWVLGVVTLYYTFLFIGAPISFWDAWIAEAFIQMVRAMSFFVPAHLGAQEGAFLVISAVLTGSPEAGLAASLVRRGREIIWVGAGLALGWRDRQVLARNKVLAGDGGGDDDT